MGWGDPRFVEDWAIPRGEAVVSVDIDQHVFYLHPSDMLLQLGRGRFPFETRHTAGHRELERDRRRHR